jgi:hypothetical protein
VRAAIFAVVAIAAVHERLVPSYAATQFWISTALVAREARPSDALIAVHRRFPPGAVLDVPNTFGRISMLRDDPHYALHGAYHHRRTASCYNSNSVPVSADVAALARELPRPAAIDALYALGFRTLVVHGEKLGPNVLKNYLDAFDARADAGQLQRIGDADEHFAWAILRGGTPQTGHRCLAKPVDLRPPLELRGPSGTIPFEFRVLSPDRVCRQPDPLEPTNVLATWRPQPGARTVKEEATRVLLPIAVTAGPPMVRNVSLALPPPGSYVVSLAVATDPAYAVAMRNVTVLPPDDAPPAAGRAPTP